MEKTSTFEKGKWIWANCPEGVDQYVEFYDNIHFNGACTVMNISCDTDYTLYINGKFVASNQYGDFEHYKIYDVLDLTEHLIIGENRIDLLVYYCGVDSLRYRKADAGLIYEITSEGQILSFSSDKTLSRISPSYISGKCLSVSRQLGFSFEYDAKNTRDGDYLPSVCVSKNCKLYPRPIKKSVILDRQSVKEIKKYDDTHFLIDFGREVVGLPTLDILSDTEQKITVAWGEHLDDGCVRKIIAYRNFYYEYNSHRGHNTFTNYMLRLSCRYIEVFAENPIKINYVGIIPQVIEVEDAVCSIDSADEKRIYGACVNTLKLCMMEHYVDCPWREQALYALDSRNQMLCGYYAFKGGNAEYARANLKLISEDKREDGLLSICYPSGGKLAIPSFSLHYVTAMKEYIEHTSDTSLAKEYLGKIKEILSVFLSAIQGGLVYTFTGENVWNFYDWSEFSSGSVRNENTPRADAVINLLLIKALDSFKLICSALGEEFLFSETLHELRKNTKEAFYTEKKLFTMNRGCEQYTALVNALAILVDLVTGEEAEFICDSIVNGKLVNSSLSLKIFAYEALMKVDSEKYREYILSDIRSRYNKMLEGGGNTVWETENGASDFDGAGSLCHGWSAVPVYIYHRLGVAKPKI